MSYISHDKLIEFTLVTANEMSNALKIKYIGVDGNDEDLTLKLNDINTLNKFRVDFLLILHDQMKWHSEWIIISKNPSPTSIPSKPVTMKKIWRWSLLMISITITPKHSY